MLFSVKYITVFMHGVNYISHITLLSPVLLHYCKFNVPVVLNLSFVIAFLFFYVSQINNWFYLIFEVHFKDKLRSLSWSNDLALAFSCISNYMLTLFVNWLVGIIAR